jgi:hypothetical protein
MTTAMGREARRQLTEVLKTDRTIILGLANEYLEYATTRAEYDEQDYEGGSTLFGPYTGSCYIGLLKLAAEKLERGGEELRGSRPYNIPAAEFSPGTGPLFGARFGISYWGSNVEYTDQELRSPFATAERLEPDVWPRFEWKEEEREDEEVLLWEKRNETWVVEEDDNGADPALATFLADGTKCNRTWDAYWFPKVGHGETTAHMFEVKIRKGAVLCSESFSINDIRAGRMRLPLLPSSGKCPP